MTFELYFWFSELEGDVECENCKELMTLIDTIVSSQKVEDFVSILIYFVHIYTYIKVIQIDTLNCIYAFFIFS